MSRYQRIILLTLASLTSVYYLMRPIYEIKIFKLGFYPYTYLTEMIYTDFTSRKLLYIYGNCQENMYPEKDYIVLDNFSGFDAVSEVIANIDSNQNVIMGVFQNYAAFFVSAFVMSDSLPLL